MKNERGVTLIELLATITIAVFVMGTTLLLFSQVNLEWNASTNQYNDSAQSKRTMDTYTKLLSGALSVVYIQSNSGWTDLRFQTPKINQDGKTKVTKVFHYENGTITLSDFNANDFTNASPPASDYSNSLQLASNVASMPQYVDQSTNQPLQSGTVMASSLISITINFNYKQVGSNGSVSYELHPVSTSVKLLQFMQFN